MDFGEVPGALSEDCLYLNICTPSTDGSARPVMFWIHGGGFMNGAANEYDGSVLSQDNDVVVVTINYRLGLFGFLDLSQFGLDYAGSASLGFQDQIAALQWVHDNIADYGGDPGNVTIMSESAGGSSVLALLGAPATEGLFHKAASFSAAPVLGSPADTVTPLAAALDTAPSDLLAKLLDMDAEELFKVQLDTCLNGNGSSLDGTAITRTAPDAIRARGGAGAPLIAGCTRDEGTFLVPGFKALGIPMEALFPFFAKAISDRNPGPYLANLEELASGSPGGAPVRIWYDLFHSSSLRSVLATTEAGPGGRAFQFDVPTSHELGITHASDIPFIFNSFSWGFASLGFHDGNDPAIRDLASRWSRTLAAFARTGDPNGAGLPVWRRYDSEARACLVLDLPPRTESDPDGEAFRQLYGLIQDGSSSGVLLRVRSARSVRTTTNDDTSCPYP